MSRTAVIVQARVGSTRLPGKVLRKLGDKTVLGHALARCAAIENANIVVCATSNFSQDDPIAEEAARLGVQVFRGSESDVLARYLGAARAVAADTILRVTSDCPLIDPRICADVIALRATTGADYASNNMPRSFPHGLDCEAFTTAALAQSAAASVDAFDHEHVTPWLRRKTGLRRANLVGPGWPSNMHRWTLDYPEDLAFFESVFAALDSPETAGMQDVLSLLAAHPELAVLNAGRRLEATPVSSDTGSTIVFRCDASLEIGLGHAMRCAALQDRLETLGWRCLWAVEPATAAFLGIGLSPTRIILLETTDPQDQADRIGRIVSGAVTLVVDRYGVPASFAQACRAFAARIVHFDDFGAADLPADLAIVIGADPASMPLENPHRRIGGNYAPLRWQFSRRRAASLESRITRSAVTHALIAFGGTDPTNASGLALEAVLAAGLTCDILIGGRAKHLPELRAAVARHPNRVRLLADAAEVAQHMAKADFAIGAPGVGTWERAAMGLPVLMVGIAENQRINAEAVAMARAGILCGFLTDGDRDAIRETLGAAIAALQADPARLVGMAESAAKLCDGRGAMRIAVAALPEAKLKDGFCRFRLIEPEDETLILEWQSAPETRRYASNPHAPSAAEHRAWFNAKLASDADWFLIAETPRGPAGFVRLDWIGDTAGYPIFIISIATAPGHYRRGIAQAMLHAARNLAPRARLLAKVLAGNQASQALFESLGYRPGEDGYLVSKSL